MEPVLSPAAAARIEALTARLDRPIVLVGLMGVGKTTVGRRLAALLGRSFVDADEATLCWAFPDRSEKKSENRSE